MVSFVILHYKNINDTIECIESIKKIDTDKEVSIIVVDNNTLEKEEEKRLLNYTKDLIKLNENKGFANGNNAGCEYAIKKYKPDFLCVINNDIVINQKSFVDEIYHAYEETNFDIMGPKILTNNGDSVNPFYAYQTIKEVEDKINYHKKLIRIYNNKVLRNLLNTYLYVKSKIKKEVHLLNGEESKYDVALHGCALIFSKKYYKKYKDVFYSGTFLYHEEEFLDYRRRRDHLITYYDSKLELFHKEGSSLNETFKNRNNYEKLIFRNQEIIKSLTLLETIMKNNEEI